MVIGGHSVGSGGAVRGANSGASIGIMGGMGSGSRPLPPGLCISGRVK
jgi:type IV secretory pathway TrbL component